MVDWRRQAVLCVVAGRMGSQFGSWMANPTSTKQLCTPWSSSTPRAFTCLANRPSACRLARCALICPADQAPFGATAAAGSGCPGPVLLNLPIAGSPKRRAEQPFSRCTYIRLGTCGRAPYEGLLLAADSTSWFLCAPLRACVARRARPAGPIATHPPCRGALANKVAVGETETAVRTTSRHAANHQSIIFFF